MGNVMASEGFRLVMFATFASWGLAMAIKAIRTLSRREPYVFAQWDGGWVRKGKRIDKLGQQIKVVVGLSMGIGCLALLAKLVPFQVAAYALIFVAIVGFVADFVTEEKSK